jgi:hypothetical protein
MPITLGDAFTRAGASAPVSALDVTSDAPIRTALDRRLAGLLARTPATSGGFLAGRVADSGVSLELGHRLSTSWQAGLFVGKAWTPGAGWSWGATVEGRW